MEKNKKFNRTKGPSSTKRDFYTNRNPGIK